MIRRRKRRYRPKPEPRIVVKPSEELESRINREVARATSILLAPSIFNLLDSPYLVSAIYYHDGLLDGFPINKPTADPTARIVGHIVNRFASDTKIRFRRPPPTALRPRILGTHSLRIRASRSVVLSGVES